MRQFDSIATTWLQSLLILCIGSQALAIQGYQTKTGGPAGVCRLLARDSHGALTSICSGVLTQKNQILTAAHCLQGVGAGQMIAECGYQGFSKSEAKIEKTKAGNSVYTRGPKFQETFQVKDYEIHPGYWKESGNDTAYLFLDHESEIQPVEVAALQEIQEIFLAKNGHRYPGVRCMIAGYGVSFGYAGILKSAEIISETVLTKAYRGFYQMSLEPVTLNSKQAAVLAKGNDDQMRALEKEVLSNPKISATTMPGDSGSSLLCKTESGDWKSVGVTSLMFMNPDLGGGNILLMGNTFWNPAADK